MKPPTIEQITQYAEEIKYETLDVDYFYNYYSAIGWKLMGKTPIKDWKALVKLWQVREKNRGIKNSVRS